MTNPSTHQNVVFSIGNTTIMKYIKNEGIDRRTKNIVFPWEISKVTKICQTNQKSGTPKMLSVTNVFEEKSMMMLQDKNQALQECYELLTFLRDCDDSNGRREMTHFLSLSMAGTTATF